MIQIPITTWAIQHKSQYFCGNKICLKVEYYYGQQREQFLEAVPTAMDKDPFIVNCRKNMLNGSDDKCPDCGPNTKAEFSNEWLFEKLELKEKMNITAAAELEENLKTRKGIQKEIQKVQQLKDELIAEKDAVVKASARFAHFMKKNSTILTNDATEKYLNQLIERENRFGNELKQKAYEKLLKQYFAEKMVLEKQLDNASQYGDKTITTADVLNTLNALKNLKHYGHCITQAIDECNKAITSEASVDEMEVEPPKQRESPSFFKWLKKTVILK